MYLAAQNANPFGSLVAMYMMVEDPVSGSTVKLAGEVSTEHRQTGQIVTTFKNTPDLPFEELELHFFGGERAPLATPSRCGTYTTRRRSRRGTAMGPVNSSSTFQIEHGPNGGPCPGASLPFNPSLTAGATSNQAGGFSPFTMTMSREDGQQNLQAISLNMPPGLSGLLSGVKLCGEAEANAGTCGPESEIGETIVSVGVGNDPFSVKGGKVYITGPYKGAPFGLSIVNPAVAGPFNLGKVIVRAKIEVNPVTAALTITSDNEGPYKIPTVHRRDPPADQARERDDQPQRLHVQPDELQQNGDHREPVQHRRLNARRCRSRSRRPTARHWGSPRNSRRPPQGRPPGRTVRA